MRIRPDGLAGPACSWHTARRAGIKLACPNRAHRDTPHPALALLAQCCCALILRTGWSDHVPQAHGRALFLPGKKSAMNFSASSGLGTAQRLLLAVFFPRLAELPLGLCQPALLLCSGRVICRWPRPCVVSPLQLAFGRWAWRCCACCRLPGRACALGLVLWAARLVDSGAGADRCDGLQYADLPRPAIHPAPGGAAGTPYPGDGVDLRRVAAASASRARPMAGLALSLVGVLVFGPARARRGDCRRFTPAAAMPGCLPAAPAGRPHRADAPPCPPGWIGWRSPLPACCWAGCC